jgi:hypothetical protein
VVADHPLRVTTAARSKATITVDAIPRRPVATASVSETDWSGRADLRVVVLVAIGVAGLVATGVTAWAVANSPILVNRPSDAIWRSLFVAAYVAVGAYTWWRTTAADARSAHPPAP